MESKSVLKREAVQKGEPMPQDTTVSKSALTIGVDLANGPDRTPYVCPVCHNEIRGNNKVCCGVWHE